MAQTSTVASPAFSPGGGYALAAGGAILFSTKGIFIKLAYGAGGVPQIDAISLLALRMAYALPVYLLVGWLAWRDSRAAGRPLPTRPQFVLSVLVGVLGYWLASYLDFQGLVYLTAQFERLILFTYPVFVMILGALFFGGVITRWGVGALLLSYAGIAVIFLEGATATGDHVALGVMLVLGSAFAFALYQLLAKPLIAQLGSRIFTCIAMIGAGAAVLAHFFALNSLSDLFELPSRIIVIAALIAVFATVLPTFMLSAALERITPQAVSVLGTLSPVATIAMAIVLLGEPFTPTDAFGTALVIAGVGLFTWHDARQKAKARALAALEQA